MTSYPTDTIRLMVASLKKFGITNPILQAGVITITTTEGSFTPRSEMSYAKTPNDRLRMLFGKRLGNITETDLLSLKNDNTKFFDVIYGGQQGNTAVGDGWKYRGRGFNQITFRNNYQKHGVRIGIDLVSAPDRLNEIPIAADVLASFFADNFNIHEKEGSLMKRYHLVKANDVDSLSTASLISFQINAGWGTNLSNPALQAEHKKQLDNINAIFDIVKTVQA